MLPEKRPLTAVLISVYGGDLPEWFQEALDSLRGQTYPADRIHIYLGVDGPIGRQLEGVIEANRDLFWKVIKSPTNIHLPGIMNLLISHLGDEAYLFRMDSDDLCEPRRFEAQVEFMEINPEVGVLGTPILEFDVTRAWSRYRFYPLRHEELKARMHLGLPVAHPTVCIRRETMDRLGGYSMESMLNQDVELWFRAMKMGIRFANLEEPLLRFRCNTSTLSRRTREKSWNEVKLYLAGCRRLYGLDWRMGFPLLRFAVRMLPMRLIRVMYHSDLRHRLLAGKAHALGGTNDGSSRMPAI